MLRARRTELLQDHAACPAQRGAFRFEQPHEEQRRAAQATHEEAQTLIGRTDGYFNERESGRSLRDPMLQ